VRQRRLDADEYGANIDGKHALEIAEIELIHGAADQDSGIVDQDVEAAELATVCATAPFTAVGSRCPP